MALSDEEVQLLKERALQVGAKVGVNLEFAVAPNPELVGLTADGTFVVGPDRVDTVTTLDFETTLDEIENGMKVVVFADWDNDGDIYPRMMEKAP